MSGTTTPSKLPSSLIADDELSFKSLDCRLTMMLSPSRLIIGVFHVQERKLLAIKYYELERLIHEQERMTAVRALLQEDAYMLQRFREYETLVFHPSTCLYPLVEQGVLLKEDIAALNFQIKQGELVLQDSVSPINAALIYAMPAWWQQALERNFSTVKTRHCSSATLAYLCAQEKGNLGSKVYGVVCGAYLEIIAFKDGELQMHNIFPYQSVDDYAYFLVAAYHHLGFDVEQVPLILAGDVDKRSRIYEASYKFIAEIQFATRPAGIHYAAIFDDVPQPFFYHLLMSYL
jgi:hypothetical protein